MEVPTLKTIGDVKVASSPPVRSVKIKADAIHQYDMVKGICKKETIVNQVEARQALYAVCDLEVENGLQPDEKLAAEETVSTRVHAELILVDLFARSTLR